MKKTTSFKINNFCSPLSSPQWTIHLFKKLLKRSPFQITKEHKIKPTWQPLGYTGRSNDTRRPYTAKKPPVRKEYLLSHLIIIKKYYVFYLVFETPMKCSTKQITQHENEHTWDRRVPPLTSDNSVQPHAKEKLVAFRCLNHSEYSFIQDTA